MVKSVRLPCFWTEEARNARAPFIRDSNREATLVISAFMPRVFIKTYGCQMNVRDSEQVALDLTRRGHELVEREEGADVVLLNTC